MENLLVLMSRGTGCRGQGTSAADERRRRDQQSAAHSLHLPLASRQPPPARCALAPHRNRASILRPLAAPLAARLTAAPPGSQVHAPERAEAGRDERLLRRLLSRPVNGPTPAPRRMEPGRARTPIPTPSALPPSRPGSLVLLLRFIIKYFQYSFQISCGQSKPSNRPCEPPRRAILALGIARKRARRRASCAAANQHGTRPEGGVRAAWPITATRPTAVCQVSSPADGSGNYRRDSPTD